MDVADVHVVYREKALQIMEEKKSQLCIGLDLTVPKEEKLNQALEIIDLTHDLAASYKPNRQYWLGFSQDDMLELTKRISKYNSFSIIDHKLSDIGSSNLAAFNYADNEGFDFITVSPFPGNMKENYETAREIGIGIISLVLMSNPDARWMKTSGKSIDWAKESELYSDGIVIGTTNHVTKDVMLEIANYSVSPFVLAPGIGKQGGSVQDVLDVFGKRVLFNVSRGVTQSSDIRSAAENYYSSIHG